MLAVLILVTLNIRGGSSSRPAIVHMAGQEAASSSDSSLATEVKLLRERVAQLEAKLGAKIVSRAIVSSAKGEETIASAPRDSAKPIGVLDGQPKSTRVAVETDTLQTAAKAASTAAMAARISAASAAIPTAVVAMGAPSEERRMSPAKPSTVGLASW